MYTGSMRGSGAMMFAVWGYVLTHQRGNRERTHFTVELNPEIVAFLLGEAEGEVAEVIQKCCEPDPKSRSEDKEGRKLEKLGSFLYEVVNGAYYDKIQRELDKRESDRQRQAKQRAKKAGLQEGAKPETECSTTRKLQPPSIEEVKLAAAKIGLSAHEAEKFIAHYESNGWRVGKNPMKSLNGSLAGWKLRMEDNHGKTSRGSGGRGFDRNKGTFNEGKSQQYDTARIQAARELQGNQPGAEETAG